MANGRRGLTLTFVVFELEANFKHRDYIICLTLTLVVFELVRRTNGMNLQARLTLTLVVFESKSG